MYEVIVNGIRKKDIVITGKKHKEDKLKLIVDDSEIILEIKEIFNQDSMFNGNNVYFIATAILPKNFANLKVLINDNIIYTEYNNILKEFTKIIKSVFKLIRRIFNVFKRHNFFIPPKVLKRYVNSLMNRNLFSNNTASDSFYDPMKRDEYQSWLLENKSEINYKKFKYNPLISILIPVYNVKREYLIECLESVLRQTYDNFEICIADDCSTLKETIDTLKEYEKKDARIKIVYRKNNGNISEATNSALKVANGEFISLLDNDDVLVKDALYYVVEALNNNKKLDMIYTDEDKLDSDNLYRDPFFKPDFSMETFYSINYICHFTTIRKKIIDKVGGFRSEYNGSQDYDLFLRVIEKTNNIHHIPKILYHWRMIEGSTSVNNSNKSYAYIAGKRALEDHFKRIGKNVKIEEIKDAKVYHVSYILEGNPLVSIIIPTRDKASILKRCLKSIYKKTNYNNYEIIVVDNGSNEENTFKLFNKYKKKYSNFKVLRVDKEFNYSYLNNEAVKIANGEYIVLLNNDIEVITNSWLYDMLCFASQKEIGCVGARLLYPETTIQHAGVVLGLGGVASHIYIGKLKDEHGYFNSLLSPHNYSAVTAACLMIKKDIYNLVGGLDENLKVAYNDVDFCIKVREKGYRNVCLSRTKMYHYESASRGSDIDSSKLDRFKSEINYMNKKWKDLVKVDPYYNNNLSYSFPYYLDKKGSVSSEK